MRLRLFRFFGCVFLHKLLELVHKFTVLRVGLSRELAIFVARLGTVLLHVAAELTRGVQFGRTSINLFNFTAHIAV